MPRHCTPWPEVRAGLPMTDLDWELLARLDEVDPQAAGVIIGVLAQLKHKQHIDWVDERWWWEFHNPKRVRGGLSPLQEKEPFLGEPYA